MRVDEREFQHEMIRHELRRSKYWRDGPPVQPAGVDERLLEDVRRRHGGRLPSHFGKFAPRFGGRPEPPKIYEVAEPCPWSPKPMTNTLQAINMVTGHLGAGKSYYGVRKAAQYAAAGKYVMLNFDLVGDWYGAITAMTYTKKEKVAGSPGFYQRMRYILRHVYRFYDQSQLYDWTLPGDPDKEDRGLLVVDEAGLRNNTKTWKSRQDKAKAETGDELAELEWFVHMRKLGWTCLMLTQDSSMVDKQVQGTTSNEIHLRNLNKVKLPIIGKPVSRKPFFIAVNYYHEGRSKMINGRETYGLKPRIANLYKSNYKFSRRVGDEGRVRLMYDWERATELQPVPYDPACPVLA